MSQPQCVWCKRVQIAQVMVLDLDTLPVRTKMAGADQ